MKLKIANKKKFMLSISVIIGLIILIIFISAKSIYSNTSTNYMEETIISGDTLWSIAQEQSENNNYYKNQDIRKIVQDIKTINNLETSNLNNGQKIKIPVYL